MTARRMLPMLRGKDALSVEDGGDHLTITAMLADGAQLRRSNQIVFKRQATLRREDGAHFRVAVKVLDLDSAGFPEMARSAKLAGELGDVGIVVEGGILKGIVPTYPEATRRWRAAREGDTIYKLVNFMLPTYRALGSDSDGMTLVEVCVSRWIAEGAKELPSWVLKSQ